MISEQILKYPIIFFVGFISTLVLTPAIRTLANKFGMVDQPGIRRVHLSPIPTSGGISLFLGFHLVCLVIFLFPWRPFSGILDITWWQRYFLISLILLAIGIVDDLWEMSAVFKLIGQIFIALLSYFMGIRFGKMLGVELPMILDVVFTMLWILAMVNAFNLIDGIDGLAAGLAAIASCGIAGALLYRHLPGDALVMIGLMGVCLAFLKYNYHPASIFLGDSGSMFLGYSIAVTSISTGSKGTTLATLGVPLLAAGIPLIDTLLTILRRSIRHLRSSNNSNDIPYTVMQADREHIHHHLLKKGMSQNKAAIWLYSANIILVLMGLFSLLLNNSGAMALYIITFGVATYVIVKHLASKELWDERGAVIEGLHQLSGKEKAVIIYPLIDCILLSMSLSIAILSVHYNSFTHYRWMELKNLWFNTLPIFVGIPFVLLAMAKTYRKVWSRASFLEYFVLGLTITAGIMIVCGIEVFINGKSNSHTIILQSMIYWGFAVPLLTGFRMFYRAMKEFPVFRSAKPLSTINQTNILLYGAGNKSTLFLKNYKSDCLVNNYVRNVVGFIDDDRNLRKRFVHGLQIFGGINELNQLIEKYDISELIITADICENNKQQLAEIAQKYELKLISLIVDEVNFTEVDYDKNGANKAVKNT